MLKNTGKAFFKRIGTSILAIVFAIGLCPLQAFSAEGTQTSGDDTPAASTSSAYALIEQAESEGNCEAGEALVVYHASGASKGSTGTIAIETSVDPLATVGETEGFAVEQTWDLSAADSTDTAAQAQSEGALSTLSEDGSTIASGSDVRVALVKDDSISVADLVAQLESLDFVECAAPNYHHVLFSLTNDTYGDYQYNLLSDTAGVDYAAALTKESKVGSKIGTDVVAVCDTGFDYTNPDLADQAWTDTGDLGLGPQGSHGYNGSNNTYDPMPGAGGEFAHGTHCAGIIAAQSNNGQGVASIAGSSNHTKIMGLRISNDDGDLVDSAIAGCYEYLVRAALAGVNIVAVNDSWGSSNGAPYNPVLDYLVNQAGKAGVLSCFAAGNENVDVANYYDTVQLNSPYSIVVAASNSKNWLASYSCYNATAVDVAAPGSCILSTIPNDNSAHFDALLTKLSGDYNSKTNPNGKADKLSYYTDIASLKNAKDADSAANDFSVVLIDNTTGDALSDDAQKCLTVATEDSDGNAYTINNQNAIKISIDYKTLETLDIKVGNVKAKLSWTIDNPFKGKTDLTASEYSVNVSGDYPTDSDEDLLYIIPSLVGKDSTGASKELVYQGAKNSPLAILFGNDFIEFDNGYLDAVDTTSDTLNVVLYSAIYDGDTSGYADTETFFLTAYGIGKNTNSANADSAEVAYGYMSGTSMATPMISGCIGELAALYPDYTPLQLRGLICGGTTTFSRSSDEAKIASGGRFTFDVALNSDKVNANTWSITTERNIITVHGYALDGATLKVDGTAVTPTEQTADSITFTADTALMDGTAHRFDVTDGLTGRTYKASYVVPDGAGDSLTYVHSLPVTDTAADDTLVASTDCLYLADGYGAYLYSCTDPSDSTTEWATLKAPGTPWEPNSSSGINRGPMTFAYANGKIYAFARDSGTDKDGWPLAVIYCATYDIASDTWSAFTELGSDVSATMRSFRAGIYNGTVCCTGIISVSYILDYGFIYYQKPDGTFAKESTLAPDTLGTPFTVLPFGDSFYGISATVDSSTSTPVYTPALAVTTLADYNEKADALVFRNAGAISGLGTTTDEKLVESIMTDCQATAGNGIVIAMGKGLGSNDLALITTDGAELIGLGSYGFDAASGYAVDSMVMLDGKLYINAVDHAADSEENGLYTIPDEQSAKLSALDVDATATSTRGGTATVEDWRGEASDSITVIAGETATWKASAKPGFTLLGWYDGEGNLVSRDASYSMVVDSMTTLEARFTSGPRLTRLWGQSALDTATAIIGEGDFARNGTVVLATADNFPDALTAAGIAGLADAPVMLTSGSELSEQTSAQLSMLRPQTVIVCGGTAAITDEVAEAAKTAAGASRLYRCAGTSRSGTACEIYRNAKPYTGSEFGTTAFITTGTGYADALSIAPYAYAKNCPVFLTEDAKTISDETIQTMQDGGITDFYVLGGTSAVSDDVVAQLKAAGFTFEDRLSGDSRYETSNEIALFEIVEGMNADQFAVATGANYKDALTGAALCGKNNSILVLASDDDRTSIDGVITTARSAIATGYIFGGTAAVSTDTQAYTEKAIG